MWGGSGTGRAYALAFLVGAHLDRGDLDAARAAAELGLAGEPGGEGGRLVRHAVARLRLAEGSWARGDDPPRRRGRPGPGRRQPRLEPAAGAAGRGAGRSRAPAGGGRRCRRRRWRCCGAGGRPASSERGCAGSATSSAGAGLEHLREAVAVLSTTTAELEKARAEYALGRSPDVPDHEAVPLPAGGRRAGPGLRGPAGVRGRLRGTAGARAGRRRSLRPAQLRCRSPCGASSTWPAPAWRARGRAAAVPHPGHGAGRARGRPGGSAGMSPDPAGRPAGHDHSSRSQVGRGRVAA